MFSSRISFICARNLFTKGSSKHFRNQRTVKQVIESNLKNTDYAKASRTFKLVAAGSSAAGIGIICFYALKQTQETFSIMNKTAMWPQYVRERIHSTYTYFALSNVVTGIAAIQVFRSPQLFKLASRSTIPAALMGIAVVIATGIGVRALPYTSDNILYLKHLLWLSHCAAIGFVISPLCLLGGHAIQKAALYTLGIVGGLSAVAVTAPSDQFMYMGGPLAMGLGLVLVSSLAGMFLNPVSPLGAAAMSFQLYGGLALFGGFLLYDTQHVVKHAETHPVDQHHYGDSVDFPPYDPIASSLGIYLDTINIFVRLATIFGMGGSKKR